MRTKTSKYKHVSFAPGLVQAKKTKRPWRVFFNFNNDEYKRRVCGYYETEREAAIAADKYLISIGKEPVNILKRK